MSRWGLVLGGGGAKGAYQIGVFKALEEHQLWDAFDVVVGTSVGAINAVLYGQQNVQRAEELWRSMSRHVVLDPRSFLNPLQLLSQRGLFSREGFIHVFKKEIDIKNLQASPHQLFALVANVTDHRPEVFHLNQLDENTLIHAILASSAIPGIFPVVKIQGKEYLDGGIYENIPIRVAVEQQCDVIFVIPTGDGIVLSLDQVPSHVKVINFNDFKLQQMPVISSTLGFEPKTIDELIRLGYRHGSELIRYLRNHGIIRVTRNEKWRHFVRLVTLKKRTTKNYYSLDDIGYSMPKDMGNNARLADRIKEFGKEHFR